MPPYGEKFEGGYIVEKNPITGGSRLIYPPKGESLTEDVEYEVFGILIKTLESRIPYSLLDIQIGLTCNQTWPKAQSQN